MLIPWRSKPSVLRLTPLIGWLSPELYLRRPPAKNEQYRLDRMLQAAAQRGVRVNVIVYKEVTQALTRMYLLTVKAGREFRFRAHYTDGISRSVLLTHQARS